MGSLSWAMPGRAGNSLPGILAAARVRGGPGGSSCRRPGSSGAGPGSGSGSWASWSGGTGSGGSVGSGIVPLLVSLGESSDVGKRSWAENRNGLVSGLSVSSVSGSESSNCRC